MNRLNCFILISLISSISVLNAQHYTNFKLKTEIGIETKDSILSGYQHKFILMKDFNFTMLTNISPTLLQKIGKLPLKSQFTYDITKIPEDYQSNLYLLKSLEKNDLTQFLNSMRSSIGMFYKEESPELKSIRKDLNVLKEVAAFVLLFIHLIKYSK